MGVVFIFALHRLNFLLQKVNLFKQNYWAELDYLILVQPADELHLIS